MDTSLFVFTFRTNRHEFVIVIDFGKLTEANETCDNLTCPYGIIFHRSKIFKILSDTFEKNEWTGKLYVTRYSF
jgi:hypothetical protein